MKAIISKADKTVGLGDKDVPKAGPEDVLIKIKAFGQNPTDWKHAGFVAKPGDIIGCDAAGVVEQAPSSSSTVKKGDRVGFFTRGGMSPDHGAFAEYCVMPADLVWKLPSNMSFEQAATIPIPFYTALQALYQRLNWPAPSSVDSLPAKATGEYFLVWSGSSSVGQYAIQLGKLSGYKVITTASKDNWDYLKSIGAEECFDYKVANVGDKIKEYTKGQLKYALDCVVTDDGSAQVGKALANGGTLVTILPADQAKVGSHVKIITTIVYTNLTGKQAPGLGDWEPTFSSSDRSDYVEQCKWAPALFEKGLIKTIPYDVAGGLDADALNKGFDDMKSGKLRAKKLVYVVEK